MRRSLKVAPPRRPARPGPVLALAALAALSGLAAPAGATLVLDLPLDEMAKRAPHVVRGVVESQESSWSEDGRRIVTRTVVRVGKHLKGRAGATVTVRQPGGTVGEVVSEAAGVARFEPGEEVVLFLEPHRRAKGEFVLVSMAAGKFAVRERPEGPVAERDVEDLGFARAGADGVLRPTPEKPPSSVPLDTLLKTVARAAGRTAP